MKKRIFSLLLAALMCLSLVPGALASEEIGETEPLEAEIIEEAPSEGSVEEPAEEPIEESASDAAEEEVVEEAAEPETAGDPELVQGPEPAEEAPAVDGVEHSPGGGFLFRVNGPEDFQPRNKQVPCSIEAFSAVPGMGYTLVECTWLFKESWYWKRMNQAVFRDDEEYALEFIFDVTDTGEPDNHGGFSVIYINGVIMEETERGSTRENYAYEEPGKAIIRVIFGKPGKTLITTDVSASGVKAPVAGEQPVFTASVPRDAHYSFNSVKWYGYENNSDAGWQLNKNSFFEAGYTYECRVLLAADKGYEFSKNATASLNGSPADIELTETSDGWDVAAITRRFFLPPPLTRVDFTSLETELTAGEEFPHDNGVLKSGSHCTAPIYYWTDAAGHVAYGEPVARKYYWLNVYIEPEEGYTFGAVGTTVPVYLNGTKLGDGEVVSAYGRDEILLITFKRTGPTGTIASGAIDLTAPVGGEAIPTAADGKPAEGSRFTIAEQYWSSGPSSLGRLTSGTFTPGTTYYYCAELVPDDGWRFAETEDSGDGEALSITANGAEPFETSKFTSGTVMVYVPFKPEGKEYSGAIELKGFSEPMIGAAVESNVTAEGSGYTITDQGWSESVFSFTKAKTKDTTFQAGKTYYWVCTVELTGGRAFPEDYAGAVTLDGKTVPAMSSADKLLALLKGETPEGGWHVTSTTMSIALRRVAGEDTGPKKGDYDQDGVVDTRDHAYLSRALKGQSGYTKPENMDKAWADLNGDGKVNRLDRIWLSRALKGVSGYTL